MTIKIILSYAFGLILLYLIGILLVVPIKMLIKLVWNGILGGILLFIVNLIGNFIGISLVINPITALIAGFLGIPGVILLLILQNIL